MSQQYKVLVVDDDLKLRSLLERYLTEQGFVVRGVANGEQADRLLKLGGHGQLLAEPELQTLLHNLLLLPLTAACWPAAGTYRRNSSPR